MLRRTVLIALLATACGGSDAPPSASEAETPPGADARAAEDGANTPPEISEIELLPVEPTVGEPITINVVAYDAEDDRVEIEIDWYVNNREVESGASTTLETRDLRRGDRVFAVVRAFDGEDETEEQSESVDIGNSPPRITALSLEPLEPTARDQIQAKATASDPEGDDVEIEYTWLVNGVEIEADGSVLDSGVVKRGDVLQVRAIAYDEDEGRPLLSGEIEIGNAAPEITSEPKASLDGAVYRYQVQATDADGDRSLRYGLVSGPEGMEIDLLSGLVTWDVPVGITGTFPVELSVRDASGAEGRQHYVLEFGYEEPASPESE